MDSGLGVQWPLSPFATAIATGALFAFCVTLWNTRHKRHSSPESDGIAADDSVVKDVYCPGVPEEYQDVVRRHVLKLEIPTNIVDASAFGFPSVSFSDDNQRQDVLTFALPQIKGYSNSVTVKLLDCDGKFSKLNFGPYLRERVNFRNPLFYFPKPDPRESLTFRFSGYSEYQKSFLSFRYPFRKLYDKDITQEKFPSIFKKFNQIDKRFLRLKYTEGPITSEAKRIIYCSDTYIFNREDLVLQKNKSRTDVKNKVKENSDESKIEESIKSETEQVNTEIINCDSLQEKNENLEKIINFTFFGAHRDNSSDDVMNKSDIENQNCSTSEINDIFQEIENNLNKQYSNDCKNNLLKPVIIENEGKINDNLENHNLNQNVSSNAELENFSDLQKGGNIPNKNDAINLVKQNDVFIVSNGTETNSESLLKTNITKCSVSILPNSGNIANGDKKETHIFIETPVHLSVEIDNTYGSGNCQKVKCDEPVPEARVPDFGRNIEVKKSLNLPKASLQESKSMKEDLECIQESGDKKEGVMTTRKSDELSFALEMRQTCTIRRGSNRSESSIDWKVGEAGTTNDRDVRRVVEGGCPTSRTQTDEREVHEARSARRQMDRRTGERSEGGAVDSACFFETSVTSETRIQENGGTRVSAAVTSSLTVDTSDVWSSDNGYSNGVVKTVVTTDSKYSEEEVFRPTYEEYMPDASKSLDATINELKEIADRPLISSEPSSPRVSRLKALLNRDEERRARMKFFQEKSSSVNGSGGAGASIDGEWDRILRDVLASVSELEHWEKDEEQRRRCDVTESKREDADKRLQHHQSESSPRMEGEAAVISPTKGETPTKVKNLRFKLDPDVFDVPSDDSFYDDDDDDFRRPGWRRQPKYRTFSTLELSDEPVKLVSVHASVVPAGHKLVARPVGIDLHVRLTEERQSKRAHVGTSPSQVKRRSPVSDARVGWCQELSPVTENVDWRETFTTVPKDTPETKTVPNGILKTPSPKADLVVKDSANPFKVDSELTNGTPVVTPKTIVKPLSNGIPKPWKPPEKKIILPRKKFQPDPEAIDRITGYKLALAKPPLPPPVFHRVTSSNVRTSRAEIARKQYLDSKAALSAPKADNNKKFQQFLSQAQSDRARIVTSVPDLGAIEKAVSEQWARERIAASQRNSPAREDIPKSVDTSSSRGSTPDDAWASYVQSCRKHLGRRSQSMTYLETEIEIVDIPLLEDDDKWRSTSALVEPNDSESSLPLEDSDFDRSQDDLDDSGRAKSEHELRIQRSLQSLPLPSWYKQSEKPKTGFLLGSGSKEKRGWAAAKSLASSTSSLASCGLKRPIRSLRSSRENIPWSRGSPSPDGPALSLALARAFREPYLGWRARTSTSSGVSSSPRTSPPSWSAATTDEEVNGVSFDGEDAFGQTSSQEDRRDDPPSLDDTGADVTTVSMDTGDLGKLPGGEDTCDDINNMSMDTCELFDIGIVPDAEEPSPQADTGDDIDNLSTDTTEDKRKDPKFKRYSYSQSIYNSEWEEDEESRGDRKSLQLDHEGSPSSDNNKVIWIESSFVGSRTTTSIMVLPDEKRKREGSLERPASR